MPAMFPLLYLSILPLFPIYPIFLFSFLFGFTHCLFEKVREWMKLISLDFPKFIWICDFVFSYISMCINNLFFNICFLFLFFEKKRRWYRNGWNRLVQICLFLSVYGAFGFTRIALMQRKFAELTHDQIRVFCFNIWLEHDRGICTGAKWKFSSRNQVGLSIGSFSFLLHCSFYCLFQDII